MPLPLNWAIQHSLICGRYSVRSVSQVIAFIGYAGLDVGLGVCLLIYWQNDSVIMTLCYQSWQE